MMMDFNKKHDEQVCKPVAQDLYEVNFAAPANHYRDKYRAEDSRSDVTPKICLMSEVKADHRHARKCMLANTKIDDS